MNFEEDDVLEKPFEDELNMDMMESIQRHVKALSESVQFMKQAAISFSEVRSMVNFDEMNSMVAQTKKDIRKLKEVVEAFDAYIEVEED